MEAQENQKMEDQIRCFVDDLLFVSAFAGDDGFRGLFTDFGQDLVHPPGKEKADVGIGAGIVPPVANDSVEALQDIHPGWISTRIFGLDEIPVHNRTGTLKRFRYCLQSRIVYSPK